MFNKNCPRLPVEQFGKVKVKGSAWAKLKKIFQLIRYKVLVSFCNMHRVDKVPSFLSSGPNWDPPPPHTQASVYPPTFGSEGKDTR